MSDFNQKCPVCDQTGYTSRYAVLGYMYLSCNSCETLYLKDKSDAPLSDNSNYDNDYFTSAVKESMSGYMDYRKQSFALRKNFRRHLHRILRYVSLNTPKSLLDVGCAYGFFLDEARQLGISVHGLDLSESAVKWMGDNLRIKGTVGFSADAPKGPFDIVTAIEVIEHTHDPKTFILDLKERISTGGVLMVHTGASDTIVARMLGRRWWYLNPPDHYLIFSRPALRKLVTDAGFEILDHHITTHYWIGLNNIVLKLARTFQSKRAGRLAQKIPAVAAPVFHFTTQMLIARKP